MLWTLLAALFMGCIVGPLARLILPGRQNLSVPMTIGLGALGSLLGAWLGTMIFDGSGDQISFGGLIMGTVGAIIVILIYGMLTGNKGARTR